MDITNGQSTQHGVEAQGNRVVYARKIVPKNGTEAARAFYQMMNERRTIREFSSQPVERAILEHSILTAGSAPSGAHRQPWTSLARRCSGGSPERDNAGVLKPPR
jgi:hypothetical protein